MPDMYPSWHKKASCLGVTDEVFFGSSEPDKRPPYTLGDIKRAQAVCGGCPVSAACLRAALINREEYGVWAGTTRKQRRAMLGAIDSGEVTVDSIVLAFVAREKTRAR